jgi:hypothetical protein
MEGTLPGSYYVQIDFAVPSQEGNGEKVQGVARWTTEARASFSDWLLLAFYGGHSTRTALMV